MVLQRQIYKMHFNKLCNEQLIVNLEVLHVVHYRMNTSPILHESQTSINSSRTEHH